MAFLRSAARTGHRVRQPRSLRWLALLAASLFLHVLALNWATHRIALPSWPARDLRQDIVTTELRFAKASPAIPARPPKPAPKPTPKLRPKAPPRATPPDDDAPPVPLAAAEMAEDAAPVSAPTGSPIGTDADAPASAVTDPSAAPTLGEPEQQAAEAPPAPAYRTDPPPSADLKYDVRATKNGQNTYGTGRIRWEASGGRYAVNGETSVLFFTVLDFHSEGSIDAAGIAPVLYSEKRFRRSQTNTHFSRDSNAISFSASTASYPREGGEQDRASIVWQLAAIGRGGSEQFHPDAEFEIFVAGTRDGERWRIRVIGQETIDVGLGTLTAWHMVRLPRSTSYDQKLDIWLAPDRQWYPVKIRFTEASGDSLDMSLADVNLKKTE